MEYFGRLYLDKEKDIIVELFMEGETMHYVLKTPNHGTGNLFTNLAEMCGLPLSLDEDGMKIIRGTLPCYVTAENRKVFIFRLRDTKVANIYPNGTIERKASIPAISKTLMSQTKDYRLDFKKDRGEDLHPPGVQVPHGPAHPHEREPGPGHPDRARDQAPDPVSPLLRQEAEASPHKGTGRGADRAAVAGQKAL